MKVKCHACKHTHEIASDHEETWKCACAATSDKCDCDHTNWVEETE